MQQLHNLFKDVLENGTWKENRTGVRTISVPGAHMRFNLQKGFPAVTSKKLAWKAVRGEGIRFLQGKNSAKDFREFDCKVWDQNANENKDWLANPYREGEDHLGSVYGVQWRNWPAFKVLRRDNAKQIMDAKSKGFRVIGNTEDPEFGPSLILYKAVDQIQYCLDTIKNNPNDRRILFHGWNWAQLDEMALPPCHLLYHFIPDSQSKEMSLCLYIRSNDLGLGAPFNIAEAAFFLHLFCRFTGYTPKWLSYFIGDAHIYENHLDMVTTQLSREPLPLPTLKIADEVPKHGDAGTFSEWINSLRPDQFELENYNHYAPVTAPMAV